MHIDPTREQFEMMKGLDRSKPINMLNLVRLNYKARYEEGAAAEGQTGAEAYRAYGEASAPIFRSVGGEIIWRGAPKGVLIGPADEAWHIAFIARYPTVGAFLSMVTNPAYQAIVFHRQAAVEDSRLIPLGDLSGGAMFG